MQNFTCTINGKPISMEVDPSKSLLDVLRRDIHLTGAKKGCGEGECGACTVLMDGKPVNSCIIPVMTANGRDILTIEGLAENGELHPLQEAFIEAGAVQCGFCTPGVILSAKYLLDKYENPTKEQIMEELSGHLCRCTGYLQFYDAINLAAEKMKNKKQG